MEIRSTRLPVTEVIEISQAVRVISSCRPVAARRQSVIMLNRIQAEEKAGSPAKEAKEKAIFTSGLRPLFRVVLFSTASLVCFADFASFAGLSGFQLHRFG